MLACTRIGAVHSVVFAGFSADSLRDRIVDASSKWVITADEGVRGGRKIPLKHTVDTAVHDLEVVRRVFVYTRTGKELHYHARDVKMSVELPKFRAYAPAEPVDSEDIMFLLYTSGAWGLHPRPAHSTLCCVLSSFRNRLAFVLITLLSLPQAPRVSPRALHTPQLATCCTPQ